MKTFILVLCIATISAALAQTPPISVNNPETAIRITDEAWAKAIASKSVERTVSLYDSEAITAGSAMALAQGLAAFRAMWTEEFAQPKFSLSWKADKIIVNESGTIAYSTGIWQMAGPNETGPYLAVWRKQPDNRWKILIDAAWYDRKPDAKVSKKSGSALEVAIQRADEALAKAIVAKSVESTVSLYDEEAITAGSAMPSAQGRRAIREMYQNMFAQPGFALSLKTDKVAVTASGTIAYSTGIWDMSEPKSSGPYLVIWRRQPDGRWKIVIDSAWYSRTSE